MKLPANLAKWDLYSNVIRCLNELPLFSFAPKTSLQKSDSINHICPFISNNKCELLTKNNFKICGL